MIEDKNKFKKENTRECGIDCLYDLKKQIEEVDFTNYEKRIVTYMIDYTLVKFLDLQGEYCEDDRPCLTIERYINENDYFDYRMNQNYYLNLIEILFEVCSKIEVLLNVNLKEYIISIGKDEDEVFDYLTRLWNYTYDMSDIFFKIFYKLEDWKDINFSIYNILSENIGKITNIFYDENDDKLVRTVWKKYKSHITQSELEEENLIRILPNVVEKLQELRMQLKREDKEILKYVKNKLLDFLDLMIWELEGKDMDINPEEEVSKFDILEKELDKELSEKKLKMSNDDYKEYVGEQLLICANLHYLIRKYILYFTIEDVPSLKIDCSKMQMIENILNTFVCATIIFLSNQR